MTHTLTAPSLHRRTTGRALLGLSLLSCLLSPAWALYKVVGPDGRVVYTDRPPTDRSAKPLDVKNGGEATAGLPYELQQVSGRYPVTLYVSNGCGPCDRGRDLLRTRGIPFREVSVNSTDDVRAYSRQEGTDQLPSLRIGAQQLKGYLASEWNSYLDAAGYPTTSKLPATYTWPKAVPMAGNVPASPAVESEPARPSAPAVEPTAPSGFRF